MLYVNYYSLAVCSGLKRRRRKEVCPLFLPLLYVPDSVPPLLSPPLPSTRRHIPSSTPPNWQTVHPLSLHFSTKKPVHMEPTSHSSLSSPSSEVRGDTQVVVMALCTIGTPDLELPVYYMQLYLSCTPAIGMGLKQASRQGQETL